MFSADPLPPWCCLSFVLAGNSVQGWNTDDGCSAPILLSFYLSSHHLHPPPPMFSLYTYPTFCLLNWFPASCLFFPFLLSSSWLFSPCSCTLPTQILHPFPLYLLSISARDLALSFLLLILSLIMYIIRFNSSSLLPISTCVFPPIPLLSSCLQHFLASYLSLLVWLPAFAHLASAPCLAHLVGLLPIILLFSFLSLSALCRLNPDLCGSGRWWDVKSEACICVFACDKARLTHRVTLEDMVLYNYLVYSTMLYRSRVHAQRQKSQGLHLHLTPMSALL